MTTNDNSVKPKTVFDHLNHIRGVQSTNYMDSLTEEDLSTFNKIVILKGLSMDVDAIENIGYISPYITDMPVENFYMVCCLVVPKTRRFFPWVKTKSEKINPEILSKIKYYFNISRREAANYYRELLSSTNGINELKRLLQNTGMEEKEISKLLI